MAKHKVELGISPELLKTYKMMFFVIVPIIVILTLLVLGMISQSMMSIQNNQQQFPQKIQ